MDHQDLCKFCRNLYAAGRAIIIWLPRSDLGYHIDVPSDDVRGRPAGVDIWPMTEQLMETGPRDDQQMVPNTTVVREILDNPGQLPTFPTRDFVDHLMMS